MKQLLLKIKKFVTVLIGVLYALGLMMAIYAYIAHVGWEATVFLAIFAIAFYGFNKFLKKFIFKA